MEMTNPIPARYINNIGSIFVSKENLLHCPRVKFREDLMAQLTRWREEGNKLVVCLDANENIYHKSLGKVLRNVDGLNMQEVVGMFTGKKMVQHTSEGRPQ